MVELEPTVFDSWCKLFDYNPRANGIEYFMDLYANKPTYSTHAYIDELGTAIYYKYEHRSLVCYDSDGSSYYAMDPQEAVYISDYNFLDLKELGLMVDYLEDIKKYLWVLKQILDKGDTHTIATPYNVFTFERVGDDYEYQVYDIKQTEYSSVVHTILQNEFTTERLINIIGNNKQLLNASTFKRVLYDQAEITNAIRMIVIKTLHVDSPLKYARPDLNQSIYNVFPACEYSAIEFEVNGSDITIDIKVVKTTDHKTFAELTTNKFTINRKTDYVHHILDRLYKLQKEYIKLVS